MHRTALFSNLGRKKSSKEGRPTHAGYAALSSDMSYSERQDAVQEALEAAENISDEGPNPQYLWICDMFDSSVVYRIGYGTDDCYKRSYVMDDSGAVTLGDRTEVTRKTVYEAVATASMSLKDALFSEIDGDWVLYKGAKLFEAGEYPEWKLKVLPSDLVSMQANFTSPIPGDLEHIFARTPADKLGNLSALRGELTELRSIYVDETDPSVLRGDVAVRSWLDPKLEGKGVSVEIPVENPTSLSGYTLTVKPRVQGAALMSSLMSELAAHQTTEDPEMTEEEKRALAALQTLLAANPNALQQLGAIQSQQTQTTAAMSAFMGQVETINRKQREDAATALFSSIIGTQVGKKFTPAQANGLRDLFIAGYCQAGADDSKPDNQLTVALFDEESKGPKRVESRTALFTQLVASMVDSIGKSAVTTGEVWGSDMHVIRSSTPLGSQVAQFSEAGDPAESDAELDKWAESITAEELKNKGIYSNGAANGTH